MDCFLCMCEIIFYVTLWRSKKREKSMINHCEHGEMFSSDIPKIPGKHRGVPYYLQGATD